LRWPVAYIFPVKKPGLLDIPAFFIVMISGFTGR
jgi:hypothetical protein